MRVFFVPRPEFRSDRDRVQSAGPITHGNLRCPFFIGTTPDKKGQKYGYAIPVSNRRAPQGVLAPMFIEVHTVLVAWWLTMAWRSRQLVRASSALATAGDVVAAAACVRPLVETAAAVWANGRDVVSTWDEIKCGGEPSRQDAALSQRDAFMVTLNRITLGGKFGEGTPGLAETWGVAGQYGITNVLTQITKLAKVAAPGLQDDYEWLCNAVHPSIGNTFAMAAPPLIHPPGTTMLIPLAGRPTHLEGPRGAAAERTVENATVRAATESLRALRLMFDALLRTIDDIALTTHAPLVARDAYWRNIVAGGVNERCPCRSGLKVKRCPHEWGGAAPPFPTRF